MNLLRQIADTSTKDAARSAADRLVAGLPAIDGEVDGSYLSDALGRAGRPTQVSHLQASRLDGGRISANVFSLKADAGAFVLKKFVPEPWRKAARPQGWLFPGRDRVQPMTTRQLNRACHAAGSTIRASMDALLFDRDDLLDHRSGVDQCARLTRHNSGTAPAALKSP